MKALIKKLYFATASSFKQTNCGANFIIFLRNFTQCLNMPRLQRAPNKNKTFEFDGWIFGGKAKLGGEKNWTTKGCEMD